MTSTRCWSQPGSKSLSSWLENLLFPSFAIIFSYEIQQRRGATTTVPSSTRLGSADLLGKMSPVDIITSLRGLGLSSVALWPVLMNWRLMVSYVPPLEHLIYQNEQWITDAIRSFLASWYGVVFGLAVCAVALSYLANTVWKSLRSIVLSNWHTTCSIPKSCAAYGQVYDWVKENPNLRNGILFLASETTLRKGLDDNGIDFDLEGMNSVDDIRKIKGHEIVSGIISAQMNKAPWRCRELVPH